MNEKEDIKQKLQNLVKKKNTQIVVIKQGSVKTNSKNNSGFSEDYYPSYDND